MKLQIITTSANKTKHHFLALPIFEDDKADYDIALVGSFLKDNPKFGKLYETQLLYTPDQKIVLVGAGKKDKLDFEKAQNIAGTAVKSCLSKTQELALSTMGDEWIEAVAIGVNLAFTDPAQEYRTQKDKPTLKQVDLLVNGDNNYQNQLKRAQILADSINLVRRLGDMPANDMTPTFFLQIAKKIAKENKLGITVLDEAQARTKGMGAFCGVAQGSDEPSFMIALEYLGDPKSKNKWGFVGKGITFDTGGLSIKPADRMSEMKYDMAGAAAVLGAIEAIAKLGLKTNVVSVMAVTENQLGAKAQRPGDIVKSYCGKTVEIDNTDAEGRLVLLDAIAFAQKNFKANKLIDLATLTGAIIVALGDFIAGVFGNNREFNEQFIQIGSEVGERYWEMPMDEEFNEWIKSDFADIVNTGKGGSMGWRTAGPTNGAKFIEAGVEEGHDWIHLDIAGTAWDMKPRPYKSPGASGFGVKSLVHLIDKQQEKN